MDQYGRFGMCSRADIDRVRKALGQMDRHTKRVIERLLRAGCLLDRGRDRYQVIRGLPLEGQDVALLELRLAELEGQPTIATRMARPHGGSHADRTHNGTHNDLFTAAPPKPPAARPGAQRSAPPSLPPWGQLCVGLPLDIEGEPYSVRIVRPDRVFVRHTKRFKKRWITQEAYAKLQASASTSR